MSKIQYYISIFLLVTINITFSQTVDIQNGSSVVESLPPKIGGKAKQTESVKLKVGYSGSASTDYTVTLTFTNIAQTNVNPTIATSNPHFVIKAKDFKNDTTYKEITVYFTIDAYDLYPIRYQT